MKSATRSVLRPSVSASVFAVGAKVNEQQRWVRIKGGKKATTISPPSEVNPTTLPHRGSTAGGSASKSFGFMNSEGFGSAPSVSLESIREELRKMSAPPSSSSSPTTAATPSSSPSSVVVSDAQVEDHEAGGEKVHPYFTRKVKRELDEVIRPRQSFGVSGSHAAAGLGLGGGGPLPASPAVLAQEKVRRLAEMSPDLRPDLAQERREFYTTFRGAITELKHEIKDQELLKGADEPKEDADEQFQRALLDFVAALDDQTLARALHCGAIDPLLDLHADETSSSPEEHTDEDDLDAEEGDDNVDVEKLLAYAGGLEATKVLTHALGNRPSDDVSTLLAKADSGDYSEFTEEDIRMVERWEKETTGMVETSNVVLRKAADLDSDIAKSLATLDRTRRHSLLDTEFQKAIRYSMKADQLDRQSQQQYLADLSEVGQGVQRSKVLEETVNPLLLGAQPLPQGRTPVKPNVADDHLFGRSKFTIPPPRADSGVPKEPKQDRGMQQQARAIQQRRQHRRDERQRQMRDFQHKDKAGSPVQR